MNVKKWSTNTSTFSVFVYPSLMKIISFFSAFQKNWGFFCLNIWLKHHFKINLGSLTKQIPTKMFFSKPQEKFFLLSRRKYFFATDHWPAQKFLIDTGKNNFFQLPGKIFSNNNFLSLSRKTDFLYLHEKVKVLHFRCVLNGSVNFVLALACSRI